MMLQLTCFSLQAMKACILCLKDKDGAVRKAAIEVLWELIPMRTRTDFEGRNVCDSSITRNMYLMGACRDV